MKLMFRLCVTAVIKKAARRCFTVTNPEVRLLKTMSSPQLDIENATNLKDKICDTIPTATSAPDRSVSGSVSDRVIDVVVDSESNDNASDSVASKLPGADAKQPTEEEIPSVLSKRAARRQRRKHAWKTGKHPGQTGTKNLNLTVDSDIDLNETSYYFENGLRKVYPYYFTFNTHVKRRWIARTVKDVFTSEFLHGDVARLEEVVGSGRVKVNGKPTRLDYKFKDNDFLESVVHRHEVPVIDAPLEILEDTEDMVVINKPCSIPVHPCGRYRHNSVTFILAKENGMHNLRTIYRLDRLTSGLLFFAKTEAKTKVLMDNIRNREMSKDYVCRVDGQFPEEIIECHEPLDVLTPKLGLWKVGPNGKHSHTTFERLSYNGTSSVIRCKLHTGRTHQIRVHLQYLGYPIINDPLYNSDIWGPERGKDGQFGKSEEQLVKELLEFHVPVKYVKKNQSSEDSPKEAPDHLLNSPDVLHPCKKLKLHDTTDLAADDTTDLAADVLSLSDGQSKNSLVDSINCIDCDPKECIRCETAGHVAEENTCTQTKQRYDPAKMTFDPKCLECQDQYRDPTIEELTMYLHALHYKGPGWEYTTPLPDWAKDGWKE